MEILAGFCFFYFLPFFPDHPRTIFRPILLLSLLLIVCRVFTTCSAFSPSHPLHFYYLFLFRSFHALIHSHAFSIPPAYPSTYISILTLFPLKVFPLWYKEYIARCFQTPCLFLSREKKEKIPLKSPHHIHASRLRGSNNFRPIALFYGWIIPKPFPANPPRRIS